MKKTVLYIFDKWWIPFLFCIFTLMIVLIPRYLFIFSLLILAISSIKKWWIPFRFCIFTIVIIAIAWIPFFRFFDIIFFLFSLLVLAISSIYQAINRKWWRAVLTFLFLCSMLILSFCAWALAHKH